MRSMLDEGYLFRVFPVGISYNDRQQSSREEQNVVNRGENKKDFTQLFNEQIEVIKSGRG